MEEILASILQDQKKAYTQKRLDEYAERKKKDDAV